MPGVKSSLPREQPLNYSGDDHPVRKGGSRIKRSDIRATTMTPFDLSNDRAMHVALPTPSFKKNGILKGSKSGTTNNQRYGTDI